MKGNHPLFHGVSSWTSRGLFQFNCRCDPADCHAARIEAQLIEAGVPRDAPTTVIERAGTPEMRAFKWPRGGMSASIRQSQVSNPAIIFVRWSKGHGESMEMGNCNFKKIA